MSLLFALLLGLLPVQFASSCVISGPSNPILFFPTQGEGICSGLESAWCFHFKFVGDGATVLESTGCAEWFLEVARNAPPYLKEELSLAAETCNADPNGVYNLTDPTGTMIVQCSPAEDDKVTTIKPFNENVSTTTMEGTSMMTSEKLQLCPVSESGGVFSVEEGREICENAAIDWCFDLEITSSFGRKIAASGCSAWLAELSEDEDLPLLERNFLKKSFLVCNQDYSAVQEGKPNAWNYRITCSTAQTNGTKTTTTTTTPKTTTITTPKTTTTTTPKITTTTPPKTTTTPPPKTTTITTPSSATSETEPPNTSEQGTTTMKPSSEMTTSDSGKKTNVCPVEGERPGLFNKTEGQEICKNSTAEWCFQYEASFKAWLWHYVYTVRGCNTWMGVVSERDGSGEFLKEAFIHCTMNNSRVFQRSIWFWSSKVTCSPAVGPETTVKPTTSQTTPATTTRQTTTSTAHRKTTSDPNGAKKYLVHLELLSALLFVIFAYA